jgi:RimJ/RimL family protein N-acetyltransferase
MSLTPQQRQSAAGGAHPEAAPRILRRYGPELADSLLDMYLTFEPKAAYQGLPPFRKEVTRDWVVSLVDAPGNTNFVSCVGERVIAHAALVHYPQLPDAQEIIIFVHQDYQHQGLGRQLFLATLNWACQQLHLQRVWLYVNWHNLPARRLYTSIGFDALPSELHDPEIEMVHTLSCAECSEEDCAIYSSALMREFGGELLRDTSHPK